MAVAITLFHAFFLLMLCKALFHLRQDEPYEKELHKSYSSCGASIDAFCLLLEVAVSRLKKSLLGTSLQTEYWHFILAVVSFYEEVKPHLSSFGDRSSLGSKTLTLSSKCVQSVNAVLHDSAVAFVIAMIR